MREVLSSPPHLSRRTVLRSLGLICVAGCTSCVRPPQYPGGQLVLAAGAVGGVYYAYAEGVRSVIRVALPSIEPIVRATGASVENLTLVAADARTVGFATEDVASDAFRGRAPYPRPVAISALARIYENFVHVVVRGDGRVRNLPDLRGLRVSLGSPGSATEVVAERLLALVNLDAAHDIRSVRLDPAPAAQLLYAGGLDAMFFCGGIPTAAIAALARQTPINLVDLSSLVNPLRAKFGDVYFERTIPSSAYGLAGPTTTVGVPNALIVNADMAEALAYDVTRALFEHRDLLIAAHPEGRRLDRGIAFQTSPLPLHPGAVRYYRNAKV